MKGRLFLCSLAVVLGGAAQTIDVGTGAPNEAIRQRFIQAFFRNNFYTLVAMPPETPVRSFGGTGLIQIFRSATQASERLAIVKPNTSAAAPPPSEDGQVPVDTFQVLAPMYAYYTSEQLGPQTVGFPTMDTRTCLAAALGACQYQIFDKNYALFVYPASGSAAQPNFILRDPFFTRWKDLGAIIGLGPATSNEANVTSSGGTTGYFQSFAGGALVRISSGLYSGQTFSVQGAVWDLYFSYNTYAGLLGFPISSEFTLADGRRRQNFEGGSIEYLPGAAAGIRLPVAHIAVQPAGSPIRLNLGDTLVLRATLYAANGAELSDRQVSWTTSNGRVVSIEASGLTATMRAVGGGVAVVQATSEGKTSLAITVVVTAPCCQVGEGAPTAAIQQAFEEAVTRNRLSLRLPTPNAVRRAGNGYVQEFTDTSGASLIIAKPDRMPAAFVVAGEIRSRWEELGGPTGILGYPVADATPTGRQLFENQAALAGSPVRVVAGVILAKWATLGYEIGPAGPPVSEASDFLTFTGTAGSEQAFREGAIYAARTGARTGQAFLVQGPMLAKYLALDGPTGALGMPASDEFRIEGRARQLFEGGELEYAAGDAEARASLKPRRPLVSVTPAVVTPGNRVRIAVGGFPAGAVIRVAVTGKPDFEVRSGSGAYAWEQYIAPGTASGRVTIRAVSGQDSAEGSYEIRAISSQTGRLSIMSGDGQTGLPGALLPQPLRVAVRDSSGNPVAGIAVRFTASPGAQLAAASVATDAGGYAETRLRMPEQEGIALVTATALGQVVTFNARARAGGLGNFPRFVQSGSVRLGPGPATLGEKGALLAAAASILRYYQNLGALPTSNGLAEPLLLNQFLSAFCAVDAQGREICDGYITGAGDPVVNLWRLAEFVNGNLQVIPESTEPAAIRDRLAAGAPVLAALALESDGTPAGAHFIVATGVLSDGRILVHDPNPALGRGVLEEYLAGFEAAGKRVTARMTAALALAPGPASPAGFLLAGTGVSFELTSAAGACGQTLEWPAVVATADLKQIFSEMFRARYCPGDAPAYQLDVASEGARRLAITDLGPLGSRFDIEAPGPATFFVNRPAGRLAVGPQQASILAGGIVNAASFTPQLAPGSLMTIWGNGLARPGGATQVEIGGLAAHVLSATAFRVNVEVPLELEPGEYPVRLRSPYGFVEARVRLEAVAPAIFQTEAGWGAIVNHNGALNSPSSPAERGKAISIYCTGLGKVVSAGSLRSASEPVKVLLDGLELDAAFAGIAPGYRGVYQVNVLIPSSFPPRLDGGLRLRQGTVTSNRVALAVD